MRLEMQAESLDDLSIDKIFWFDEQSLLSDVA